MSNLLWIFRDTGTGETDTIPALIPEGRDPRYFDLCAAAECAANSHRTHAPVADYDECSGESDFGGVWGLWGYEPDRWATSEALPFPELEGERMVEPGDVVIGTVVAHGREGSWWGTKSCLMAVLVRRD